MLSLQIGHENRITNNLYHLFLTIDEFIDFDELKRQINGMDTHCILCLGHYTIKQISNKIEKYKYCSEGFLIHAKTLSGKF